jgi:hypothetical protein
MDPSGVSSSFEWFFCKGFESNRHGLVGFSHPKYAIKWRVDCMPAMLRVKIVALLDGIRNETAPRGAAFSGCDLGPDWRM